MLSPTPELKLLILEGPGQGTTLMVRQGSRPVCLGRRDTALKLDDPAVSFRHACFSVHQGHWFIFDLGSQNGTFVNERRVDAAPLALSDRIRIGRCVLEVRSLGDEEHASPLRWLEPVPRPVTVDWQPPKALEAAVNWSMSSHSEPAVLPWSPSAPETQTARDPQRDALEAQELEQEQEQREHRQHDSPQERHPQKLAPTPPREAASQPGSDTEHSEKPSHPAPARKPVSHAAVPSETWRMLSGSAAAHKKLPKGLDAVWDAAMGHAVLRMPRQKGLLRRADEILKLEKDYRQLSDARLKEAVADIRAVFRRARQTPADVDRAFAVIREVASRTLGMRPYQNQVAAALSLTHGSIVELATGEGKTLMATMPAVIAGWRGRGCHVLTSNDYLAKRDAEIMAPIFHGCGLSVAHVDGPMPPPQRREGYAADVTYTTNKEVTADFLRDRLALQRLRGLPAALLAKFADGRGRGSDALVLRDLDTVIIDEADSILIDEAVTPLIISGSSPNAEQIEAYRVAANIARQLSPQQHYTVNHRYREVELTDAGHDYVDQLTQSLTGIWTGARRREELVTQALTARELFIRDKQYVIDEGKIVIVDESTGRLMPDRTWRDGLHQAVEAKEDVEVNPLKDTLARISFQRFFRLYKNLSGMTGTAWEARHELWQIYKLPSVLIPTHRPCIRKQEPDRVFVDAQSKWLAVVDNIQQMHSTGRPVLVGTRSVHQSELLSSLLKERKLEHQVLNAVRHAEEAQIVSGAGGKGKITVSTNMAGRGTDIKLGRGVADLGGLHVIATERHESGRVDRQLFGRAGRQGDPGSAVAYVSLEDELIQRHAASGARKLARRFSGQTTELPASAVGKLFVNAQLRAEGQALRQRKAVLGTDDWLDEFLGFAGKE